MFKKILTILVVLGLFFSLIGTVFASDSVLKTPIFWKTDTVSLSVADLFIDINGQKFIPNKSTTFHSDLGNEKYTTLEVVWFQGKTEMRMNIYFKADQNNWWINEVRIYDGKEKANWITFENMKLFETKLGKNVTKEFFTISFSDKSTINFKNLNLSTNFCFYPYAANDVYSLSMHEGDQIHLFSTKHPIIVSGKFNGNEEEIILFIKPGVNTHLVFDSDGGMVWKANETLISVRKQLNQKGKYLKTVYKRKSDISDHCIANNFPGSNIKLDIEQYFLPSSNVKLPKGSIIRTGSIYINEDTFIATADNTGVSNCQPIKIIRLTTEEEIYLPYGGFITFPGIELNEFLNKIQNLGWERNYLDIIEY